MGVYVSVGTCASPSDMDRNAAGHDDLRPFTVVRSRRPKSFMETRLVLCELVDATAPRAGELKSIVAPPMVPPSRADTPVCVVDRSYGVSKCGRSRVEGRVWG